MLEWAINLREIGSVGKFILISTFAENWKIKN